MEGPVNGHIYATVNSIRAATASANSPMSQPGPLVPPPRTTSSANHSSSPRPRPHPHQQQHQSHKHHSRDHASHSHSHGHSHSHSHSHNPHPPPPPPPPQSHHHQHHNQPIIDDYNYQSLSEPVAISQRIAPAWSPSSEVSSPTLLRQQQQQHRFLHGDQRPPSAVQADIERLDELLQELTPRLNDSPSEYLRRRRLSGNNAGGPGSSAWPPSGGQRRRGSQYEGVDRDPGPSFVQGFSPTSPPLQPGGAVEVAAAAASTAATAGSTRSVANTGRSGSRDERRLRLQRTRSLLDERDRYLTEQLRRFQAARPAHSPYRSELLQAGYPRRPGSSQQLRQYGDLPGYYSSGGGGWDESDAALPSSLGGLGNTPRRAASELDYPVANHQRRCPRPGLRMASVDREELSNYTANRAGAQRWTSGPGYRQSNGPSPTANMEEDTLVTAMEDIPQTYRRNIRTSAMGSATTGTRYQNNLASGQDLSMMAVASPVGGYPGINNCSSSSAPQQYAMLSSVDARHCVNTPDLLSKARSSGFQIRDGAARATGISYHDPPLGIGPISATATTTEDVFCCTQDGPRDASPIATHLSQQPTYNKQNHSCNKQQEDAQIQPWPTGEQHNILTNHQNAAMIPQQMKQSQGHTKQQSADGTSNNNNSNMANSIRKTAKIWYQPHMTRDEAIKYLKSKPTGSFIIRQSNTFNNSYGLAVKVTSDDTVVSSGQDDGAHRASVRHFLIESTAKGVRVRGCSNEPHFGSLTALVQQHTLTRLALPCCLVLPCGPGALEDQDSLATKTFSALYLGSIDTESVTGPAAMARGVEVLLENASLVLQAEVAMRVGPEGVTLTDLGRRLFFRRHYGLAAISFCGCAEDVCGGAGTCWQSPELRNRGISKSRIFGFIARKTAAAENMCHLFCEWSQSDQARTIAAFIADSVHSGAGPH